MTDDADDHPVGYRNPPVEHRFKKGQSGNPKGRPPKRQQVVVDIDYGLRAGLELFHREMYRPVTIRDGDKVVEMPAIQAIYRSMGVAAMKGDRWARQQLVTMHERLENEQFAAESAAFDKVAAVKAAWEIEFEWCRKEGLPRPDPFPHPDDYHLDYDTGRVTYLGPNDQQKAIIDKMVRDTAFLQQEIICLSDMYRRSKSDADKARLLRDWHQIQLEFDVRTAALPPRYRTKLTHRSYREGASRADQPLADLREQFARMMDEYRVRAGLPPRQRKPEDRT